MTYEIFKYKLKTLGFSYNVSNNIINIVNINLKPMCSISTNEWFDVRINNEFYKLDKSLQKILFNLTTELSKTPLDKRGYLKNVKC